LKTKLSRKYYVLQQVMETMNWKYTLRKAERSDFDTSLSDVRVVTSKEVTMG